MKKGFTLVELLAVIVILAIISVIAIPVVINIINNLNSATNNISANIVLKATNLYYSNSNLTGQVITNKNIYKEVLKNVKGEKPDNGSIYVNSSGKVALALRYGDMCYTKGYADKKIKSEKTNMCIAPIDYLMVQNEAKSGNEIFFGGIIARSLVEKIITVPTNIVPAKAKEISWDVSEAQNGSIMAWYLDEDNNGLYELYLGQDGGVKVNPNATKLFNYFINVTHMDLSNFDTNNVINMKQMFSWCSNLISLDLSNFNTSNVTNMIAMFNKCNSLTNLNLSHFDTSNVTDMAGMFQSCESLEKLDISHFDTSNVSNMLQMFSGCSNLISLDINNFNTNNVENVRLMFNGCSNLISLDISNFNTSNVTDMAGMFQLCESLEKLNVSGFNTNNVVSMQNMFYDCKNLKNLDLSNFDTSRLENVTNMFYSCNISDLKLNKAIFTKVTAYSQMFKNAVISNIYINQSQETFIRARLIDAGITANIIINS